MLRIELDGGKVINVLTALTLDGANKSILFDEIGENLVENAQLRFIEGIDPDGNSWIPSWRAKTQGGQTMLDTRRLTGSLTHVVQSDGVEYGTNLFYASVLHYGMTIKAVNAPFLVFKKPGGGFVRKKQVVIPARPFVGISDEDEQMVIDVVQNFLARMAQ